MLRVSPLLLRPARQAIVPKYPACNFAPLRLLSSQPPKKSPLDAVKNKLEPGAEDPLYGTDAFRYNFFSSSRPLTGLVFILGLCFAYSAWYDLSSSPLEGNEDSREFAARILNVPVQDIERLLPDGRVLMKDGSIRTP